MKKFPFIACITILCTGCTNKNIPENIKNFINGINFKYINSHLKSGEFIQTYEEKNNGEITGKNSIEFEFSVDQDEMNYHAIYNYEGNQIKNEITSKEITLTYVEQETYNYEIKTNLNTTSEILNYEKAHEKFYMIFDSGVNSYRFGGLYYGDYFAINMNKFYHLYSVNNEGTILTLKEDNASYFDTVKLSQQIDIDVNGMLLHKKEFASNENSTSSGLLIQNATYVYN